GGGDGHDRGGDGRSDDPAHVYLLHQPRPRHPRDGWFSNSGGKWWPSGGPTPLRPRQAPPRRSRRSECRLFDPGYLDHFPAPLGILVADARLVAFLELLERHAEHGRVGRGELLAVDQDRAVGRVDPLDGAGPLRGVAHGGIDGLGDLLDGHRVDRVTALLVLTGVEDRDLVALSKIVDRRTDRVRVGYGEDSLLIGPGLVAHGDVVARLVDFGDRAGPFGGTRRACRKGQRDGGRGSKNSSHHNAPL